MDVLDEREVAIDGAVVHVRVTRERLVLAKQRFLRDVATVTAAHAGCGAMRATVRAGSYFLALGRQDVRIGHAAFDDRYIVKTNDPVALRYWMSEELADAMLATYEPTAVTAFALDVTPRSVVLKASADLAVVTSWGMTAPASHPWPEAQPLVQRVDAAITAAAIAAGRSRRLAEAWRHRLEPLGLVDAAPQWCTDDAYSATLLSGRTRIFVDFPWKLPSRKDRLRTRLSIAWSGSLPRAPRTIDWIFARDGRLSIGWERIVDDPVTLTAAIAQLTRWAEDQHAPDGPYR